jgi:hypothetical protein
MMPAQWSDEARRMLSAALDGASIDGFETDANCRLWKTEGCYVVTQDESPALRVWMVGGINFRECAEAINQYVKDSAGHFTYVLFRSRWAVNLRLYGFMNPELINTELHEYRIWPF